MRRSTLRPFCVFVVAAAGAVVSAQGPGPQGRGGRQGQPGIQIEAGQECPAGTTEVRKGRCQAPDKPAPSIVDYRPKSTVVAEAHMVPQAKYPVVDIHSHLTITPANIEQTIKEMDALNLRVLNNLSGGSGAALKEKVDTIRHSAYKDRFRVFANVSWNGAGGPGWKEKEVAALRQAVADGAVGLKIFKELGLRNTKADGSRLKIDDPDLDPIFQLCAELNIPVLIHTADPAQFFEPIDDHNERWLELGLFPNRAYPQDRFPSFETLMQERDRMFARNPKTRFIAAHFAWYGNDVARASRCSRLCRTFTWKSRRCSTNSAGSPAPGPSSSPSTRTACCSGRTRTSRRSIRITGACSKPGTNTSTTTGTITHSGSCTEWASRTRC